MVRLIDNRNKDVLPQEEYKMAMMNTMSIACADCSVAMVEMRMPSGEHLCRTCWAKRASSNRAALLENEDQNVRAELERFVKGSDKVLIAHLELAAKLCDTLGHPDTAKVLGLLLELELELS